MFTVLLIIQFPSESKEPNDIVTEWTALLTDSTLPTLPLFVLTNFLGVLKAIKLRSHSIIEGYKILFQVID